MKVRQHFTIPALGFTAVLVTLVLGSVFGPVQAHPHLNLTPTPGKAQTPSDFRNVITKTERLHKIGTEVGFLSPTSTGIVNGDFESGRTGWVEYSLQGWPVIVHKDDLPVSPHSGSWAAWLGGDNNEVTYISQTVDIPDGSAALTFWEWIGSDDACGYDFAQVKINNSTVQAIDLCEKWNTAGWVRRTLDLRTYAGQRVSLQIRVETDESLISNYFVDDVVLSGTTSQCYVYLPLVTKNFWAGYFDDFSNPNSGWCVVDTPNLKMGYVSGEYQILLRQPNVGYMCVPDIVTIPQVNYTVQVDARMITSNPGSYSLVFGLRWGQGTRENYVVSVEPHTRYYRIQRRNMDGTWTTLVDWTYSSLMRPGMQVNTLRIDRWGTNILFSVNGFFVTMISDGSIIGSGLQAGVGVNSYGTIPVDVRFDNFRASLP